MPMVASAGGIPLFVALAWDGDDARKTTAAIALMNLSTDADNEREIVCAGGVNALVALARGEAEPPKGHAAQALGNLTRGRPPEELDALWSSWMRGNGANN